MFDQILLQCRVIQFQLLAVPKAGAPRGNCPGISAPAARRAGMWIWARPSCRPTGIRSITPSTRTATGTCWPNPTPMRPTDRFVTVKSNYITFYTFVRSEGIRRELRLGWKADTGLVIPHARAQYGAVGSTRQGTTAEDIRRQNSRHGGEGIFHDQSHAL